MGPEETPLALRIESEALDASDSTQGEALAGMATSGADLRSTSEMLEAFGRFFLLGGLGLG